MIEIRSFSATSGSHTSKTNNQRKREQFHLALEWNRVDVARDYIMKDDRDWEVRNENFPKVFLSILVFVFILLESQFK